MTTRRNPRCPACNSKSVMLEEFSTVGMLFHVCEDGVIRRVWGGGSEAEFSHVNAECTDCRHEWRLRGVVQIGLFEGYKERHAGSNEEPTCNCEAT